MMFEKRLKKRIQQIDKNLDSMVKNPYQKKNRFPFWAKVSIPICSVALSTAIALAIVIPSISSNRSGSLNQITKLAPNRIVEVDTKEVSLSTYNSYQAFARKYCSLVLANNNKDEEKSSGVSIPDAYISFAVAGLISDSNCLRDVLSYYELSTLDDLKIAIKEISSVLGNISKDRQGRLSGGYNLNSVWLNPKRVELSKKIDQQLLRDLEDIFDADIFYDELTSQTANQYIKSSSLSDVPFNEINLPDSDSSAIDLMSLYHCVDSFDNSLAKTYKEQYKSGNHKMPFCFGNTITEVDYIEKTEEGVYLYEGDTFYGTSISLNKLLIDFYLPNDEKSAPSSILDDVLAGNYHNKQASYIDEQTGEEHQTARYEGNIKVPYFFIKNNVTLDRDDLTSSFPNLTSGGMGLNLIENANNNNDVHLEWFRQFSTMRFNYDGFYSSSVSVNSSGSQGGYWNLPGKFELTLNHPFIFELKKNVTVDGAAMNYSLPMVIGEIVNPNYID